MKVSPRAVNPWTWQDQYGYSQGVELQSPQRWLVLAGQTAVDSQGNPQHKSDMRAQLSLALDNLDTVLRAASMTFVNVVRLNYYVTDVAAFLAVAAAAGARFKGGVAPAGTLLGVAALFHPDIMIEIEATAVA